MPGPRTQSIVPPWSDVAVAALLVAMGIVLAIWNDRVFADLIDDHVGPSTTTIVVTATVAIAPVMFRRVFPLGSLVVITVGMVLMTINEVAEITATNVAAFVALVSAGVYGREAYRDWARGLFAVAVGAVLLAFFVTRSGIDSDNFSARLMVGVAAAELVANVGFVGLGWFLGDWERRRRHLATELTERSRELESAVTELDAQVGNSERLAIAREVHDVVGHTVSLLGIQAAAARRQIARNPDAAETMLLNMEQQSRNAVDELRGLITMLREPTGEPTSPASTPTIAQLDELVGGLRAAGTEVAFSRTGPVPDSPALGVSVYRIVQEALSNAIRHGSGGIEVVVATEDDGVNILVSNDVARTAAQTSTGNLQRAGSGLAGMRERVGLHGGTFAAGRGPDGRYEVKATLPVGWLSQPLVET